jgi:alpha-tubulin suppressor-like RCC1 family protein
MWGTGSLGELGNNATSNVLSPVQTVALGTNWKIVSLGNAFTLATKTDGTLWAWGFNASGQLGLTTLTNRSSPTQVGTDTTWDTVAATASSSIAVKTDGTLWGWGYNQRGSVGDNTIISRSSPVQIGADTTWKSVAGGGTNATNTEYVSAIKTDNTLWAWGLNSSGQIGDNTVVNRSSPVQIGTDTNWSKVVCNGAHVAALKTDGTLWAWGLGTNGVIGNNSTLSRSSPVQVGTDTDWADVAAFQYQQATWGLKSS